MAGNFVHIGHQNYVVAEEIEGIEAAPRRKDSRIRSVVTTKGGNRYNSTKLSQTILRRTEKALKQEVSGQ